MTMMLIQMKSMTGRRIRYKQTHLKEQELKLMLDGTIKPKRTGSNKGNDKQQRYLV